MFRELNPLLHSELRLAVMSLLISVEEADFVYIRQQTGATAGNLSVQIDKLSQGKDALHALQNYAPGSGCLRGICGSAEDIYCEIKI